MTRRVIIATPAYNWSADVRYVHSLTQTVRMGVERGIDVREFFPPGIALIQHARNECIAAAVKYDFDDLIFIDSDEDWEPEWIFRLLNHPVDVVGIAVPRKDDVEQYNVRTPQGALSIVEDKVTGLWTAPGMTIGTGFLRLSRKAYRALWDAAEPYVVFRSADEHRHVFDIGLRDVGGPLKEMISEDNIVGEKLLGLGLPTYLDPRMTAGHIGPKRWSGNFAAAAVKFQDYERQQLAKAVAKPASA